MDNLFTGLNPIHIFLRNENCIFASLVDEIESYILRSNYRHSILKNNTELAVLDNQHRISHTNNQHIKSFSVDHILSAFNTQVSIQFSCHPHLFQHLPFLHPSYISGSKREREKKTGGMGQNQARPQQTHTFQFCETCVTCAKQIHFQTLVNNCTFFLHSIFNPKLPSDMLYSLLTDKPTAGPTPLCIDTTALGLSHL